MKYLILIFILLLLDLNALAQNNEELFSRIGAISDGKTNFLNIDGIEITHRVFHVKFSKKSITTPFKRFSIKESELVAADSSIGQPNYYIFKSAAAGEGLVQNMAYYFIQNANDELEAITFSALNKRDRDFERHFVKLLLHNEIPTHIYDSMIIDTINFAGRKIALGRACHWGNVNTVQCSGMGEMNWSVHKTLEDAKEMANNFYLSTALKKVGKITAEETVDVIFEGHEAKARKITYDIKGVNGLLVRMVGATKLEIYYVAAPGFKNYISCMMSTWDTDPKNENGLPPLLAEVMQIKK